MGLEICVRRALPVTIVLLAWLLRCWRLGFYDFRGDEVFGIEYVAAPVGRIIQTLALGEPHPPLFYLLLRSWIPLAGDGVYALRWLSAAGGTLGVALVYVIGCRLAGSSVGVAAALVTTIAPYQIWNAQDARMYTLATAFTVATIYWGWRVLVGDTAPARRSAIGYILASLLALFTHYYSIYVVLLINVFAAVALIASLRSSDGKPFPRIVLHLGQGGAGERARLWIQAQLAVGVCYLPWMLYAWPTLTSYHGNAFSPSLQEAAWTSLRTFAFGWDLAVNWSDRLLPLYGLALVVGILCCGRLRRPGLTGLLLLLWLVVPIGAVWLASRARPIFDVRYLIEASPPLYVALAMPATWLRRRGRLAAVASGAVLIAVFVPLLPALWSLYFHPTDGRSHAYSALGRYLSAHVAATDLVIVNHLDPVVRYYAQHARISAPLVTEPTVADPTAEEINAALERVATARTRIWLVPDDVGAWDRQHAVLAWLDRHTQRLTQVATDFHVIEFVPLTPAHDTSIQFGDTMVLKGYRLQPAQLAPGDTAQVMLFWQARTAMSVAATMSVQLLDQSGRLIAQNDSPPQNGRAPTTSWQTFEVIPDIHTMRLPAALPAGIYTIGVAVYPSTGGPRLPVRGVPAALAPLTSVSVR